jgi:hypothetical protein
MTVKIIRYTFGRDAVYSGRSLPTNCSLLFNGVICLLYIPENGDRKFLPEIDKIWQTKSHPIPEDSILQL